MPYHAGDWVEVRSKEEILRTLDPGGRLEGLPFMPQMFQYAGQRFRIYKRAHKTCDTVNGTGGRRLANGLHLNLRCDGKVYGGCQASCLIFWKEAWVKPVVGTAEMAGTSANGSDTAKELPIEAGLCAEADVWAATRADGQPQGNETTYSCQATQLPRFTTRLRWWDIGQYLEDLLSGNVKLGRFVSGFCYAFFFYFAQSKRTILGPPLRWLYDRVQALGGGIPFPRRTGTLPPDQPAPVSDLNLQPGDLVRVKSYGDILARLGWKRSPKPARVRPRARHSQRIYMRSERWTLSPAAATTSFLWKNLSRRSLAPCAPPSRLALLRSMPGADTFLG